MKKSGIFIICIFSGLWVISGAYSVSTSRGIWVDKAQLRLSETELYQELTNLLEAHFNTFYINTCYTGKVPYPDSKYLPQDEQLKGREDIFPKMLQFLHEKGAWVEAWPEYGFYAFHTPDASKETSRGVILDRHPDWTAIDKNGIPYIHNKDWGDFYSLCPSNPEPQDFLINLYIETLNRYSFDGINLDRMRYPSGDFCYCSFCREKFLKDTGMVLEGLKSEHVNRFIEWRKEQLNLFMSRLSERLRKVKTGIVITAAVVSPEMIDEKGQNWAGWAKKGYLDAIAPMLYSSNPGSAAGEVRKLVSPDFPVFYGLSAEHATEKFILNINALPKGSPQDGVTIWYAGSVKDDLEALVKGPFSEPAKAPFRKE